MGSSIAAHEHPVLKPGMRATVVPAGTSGMDVSNWQGQVNWTAVAAEGVRFAYIKATEATSFTDPSFGANDAGAAKAGLVRGAYHFAVPNASSGTAQANYLVDHGGGWRADGWTLPPALDIEYNPYSSDPCYGLTPAQMTSWVADFLSAVHQRTGRWPVTYTTANWWSLCMGNNPDAGTRSPLWIASWNNSRQLDSRPAGWSSYTFWQYADRGRAPGDQDVFHGSYSQLKLFAVSPDGSQGDSGPVVPPVSTPAPGTIPSTPGTEPPPGPFSPPTGAPASSATASTAPVTRFATAIPASPG